MLRPKTKVLARAGTVIAAAAMVAPLISVATSGTSAVAQTASFPRDETLYTSGTA